MVSGYFFEHFFQHLAELSADSTADSVADRKKLGQGQQRNQAERYGLTRSYGNSGNFIVKPTFGLKNPNQFRIVDRHAILNNHPIDRLMRKRLNEALILVRSARTRPWCGTTGV
jgi:hypothetical protein